ncbi:MAG: NADH-quinone oxidoreductase subunit G, partial [Candidatus Omnitrophica bacterium]|nr:NADH-quinone oxidoreductase subunit G [Candidatus Omnitrophota bacterium]
FAVAHHIDESAPAPSGLDQETEEAAKRIAEVLKNAKKPLVVSGTGSGESAVLEAAANVSRALCSSGVQAGISLNFPECNSLGVSMLEEKGLEEALEYVNANHPATVIVLENDLYRRGALEEIDRLFEEVSQIACIDHLRNRTNANASAIVPCGTFAESDGTMVNSEGRVQAFYQVFVPPDPIQESWRWIRDLLLATGNGKAKNWNDLDDVLESLASEIPDLAPALDAVVSADFRIAGQKIPRQPHRYSGRTAMRANIDIHEPKPPQDPDSPLAFSMEGFHGKPPSGLASRFWAPGWNSVQSLNKFQEEVGGPMRGGDPGKRLLEPIPGEASPGQYYSSIPAAFSPEEGHLLIAHVHHIFGSDELSVHSPGIDELRPRPYVAIHPEDAKQCGLDEESEIDVPAGENSVTLKVTFENSLPRGVAGIPMGLPEFPEAVAMSGSFKVQQGVKQ